MAAPRGNFIDKVLCFIDAPFNMVIFHTQVVAGLFCLVFLAVANERTITVRYIREQVLYIGFFRGKDEISRKEK